MILFRGKFGGAFVVSVSAAQPPGTMPTGFPDDQGIQNGRDQ